MHVTPRESGAYLQELQLQLTGFVCSWVLFQGWGLSENLQQLVSGVARSLSQPSWEKGLLCPDCFWFQ